MKQPAQSDKYSIAWFKLAEYVSRGEKERALGIYKLLSHSMDDRALARQLEGDILWSFNDQDAAQSYHEAAQLYKESKRLLQAVALYEALLSRDAHSVLYLSQLFELYTLLKLTSKIVSIGTVLIPALIKVHDIEQASKSLFEVDKHEKNISHLHQELVCEMLKHPHHDYTAMCLHIQKAIDMLLLCADTALLQKFLTHIEAVNVTYYHLARTYLENKTVV